MTEQIPHQALYRRWRAQTFSEIVGQEAVVATLRNAVATGKVSHAILFTGPRGTGKTSLARILAKALNCTDLQPNADPCDRCPSCVAIREGRALDLVEIDAASNRGIEAVRELRERLAYAPTDLRRKVYILDEAHQITKDAWNALLKSLEEPPEFVSFMFASTHPQEFPPAILSRLQRFDVRRLTVPEITGKLERILAADGREADPEAVAVIARLAAGGMRDAESILDQLLASTVGPRRPPMPCATSWASPMPRPSRRSSTAMADGDAAAGIALLDGLEDRGRDLRVFLDQVVDALRDRLLAGLAAGCVRRRRRSSRPPAGWAPSTRPVSAPAACASSSSWPCSTRRRPRPGQPGGQGVWVARPVRRGPSRRPPPSRRRRQAAAPAPPQAQPAAASPRPGQRARCPGARHRHACRRAPWPGPCRRTAAGPCLGACPGARHRAPTPPAADTSPASDAPAGDDLERLRRGWSQVVAVVSKSPALKPLIDACRPISVEGNVVTLGFPEEKDFMREIAEKKRAGIEEGIAGYLGHPVGVRCVVSNLDLLPPLPDDADAAHIMAEAQRIFAEDIADVREVT